MESSPDGKNLLVTTIKRPYSYVTTYDRFPQEVDVWDIGARPVRTAYHVASIPLADRVPIRGVRLGPAQFHVARNGAGDAPVGRSARRGRLEREGARARQGHAREGAFQCGSGGVTRTEQRYAGIVWGERKDLALLTEFDVNRRWRKTFVIDIDDPQKKPRLLWDLSLDERYKNPGNPVRASSPTAPG
jgi:hypothetical protein